MPVPVITIAQMRQWEAASWAAGVSEEKVIQRVGVIVARRALARTRDGARILVLAGKGHNGDDARCAVPHMAGRDVQLLNLSSPAGQRADLGSALERRPALIIDALFGIGLNRPLGTDWIECIERVNRSGISVLSVDVPSGLDADSGEPLGAAIRADVTLTLGAPKIGLLTPHAWPFTGRVELAPEIGLLPCPFESPLQWSLPDDFEDYPPRRSVAGHKGAFGHVAICAGSLGYHGAAVLAARGAQRAQPGLITLFTSEETYIPVASQLQSVMVRPWSREQVWPKTATAILFGPGLASPCLPGEWKAWMIRCWLESPLPVLVDASGLDWLPEGVPPQGRARIITPHPGEAARILKTSPASVQADRPAALRDLSARFGGCWVVLKGHQTLVGRGQGDIFVNSSGNPFLAQGGSGDVLAGYLAGLLAQPLLEEDPLKALRHGVYHHGAAADQLTDQLRGWTVEELLNAIPRKFLPWPSPLCYSE